MKLMLTAFSSLLLISCSLLSSNPVRTAIGAADPSNLLGAWEITEVLGRGAGQRDQRLKVTRSEDGISVLIGESGESATGLLAEGGGRLILSLGSKAGDWQIIELAIADDGQKVAIRELDFSIARTDVEAGRIAESVDQVDHEDFLVRFEATSEELAAYFAAKPEIFIREPLITLTRKSG